MHNYEQPTSFSPSSQEDIIDYDLTANFNGMVVRREDTDGNPYIDYMDFKALSNLVPQGGSGNCGAFAYDETTHTIKNGMYLRARKYNFVNDAVVASAGYAYLQIDMGTSGTATVVTGASSIPNTTNQTTYIPLYYFNTNLKPTADYRGAPTLQIWEYN